MFRITLYTTALTVRRSRIPTTSLATATDLVTCTLNPNVELRMSGLHVDRLPGLPTSETTVPGRRLFAAVSSISMLFDASLEAARHNRQDPNRPIDLDMPDLDPFAGSTPIPDPTGHYSLVFTSVSAELPARRGHIDPVICRW